MKIPVDPSYRPELLERRRLLARRRSINRKLKIAALLMASVGLLLVWTERSLLVGLAIVFGAIPVWAYARDDYRDLYDPELWGDLPHKPHKRG